MRPNSLIVRITTFSIRSPRSRRERGDRLGEVVESLRELAGRAALIDVRVPPAHVGERDLESDVALDELRDLLEALAELRLRIVRTVLRLVLLRIRRAQHLHRLEHLLPGAVDEVGRSGAVQRLEARHLVAAGRAHGELVERVHRDRRRGALENARRLRRHRDGAKRRRRALLARARRREVAVEPAVASCPWRPACRSPCNPARRSASAWCSGFQRRGSERACRAPRAA